MFCTVSVPTTKFKRLLLSGPPSLNARWIQAFLQQQDFFNLDASETSSLCFQESCGGPAQRPDLLSPTLYVGATRLHVDKHDSIGLVVASFDATPLDTQAMQPSAFSSSLPTGSGQRLDDSSPVAGRFLQRLLASA